MEQKESGISMVALVIIIIVIIILAAVAFSGSVETIGRAGFAAYVTDIDSVETAFITEGVTSLMGEEEIKNNTVTKAQSYNYLAKGATTKQISKEVKEHTWLSKAQADAIPCTRIEKETAQEAIGIKLPKRKVNTYAGTGIEVSYFVTNKGDIFTWPPYENSEDGLFYVNDTIPVAGSKIISGDWLISGDDEKEMYKDEFAFMVNGVEIKIQGTGEDMPLITPDLTIEEIRVLPSVGYKDEVNAKAPIGLETKFVYQDDGNVANRDDGGNAEDDEDNDESSNNGPVITFNQEVGTSAENVGAAIGTSFVLSGTVTDDDGIKSLLVNGTEVVVNAGGTWTTTLKLTKNEVKEIIVVATDNKDNTTTKNGYVLYSQVGEVVPEGGKYTGADGTVYNPGDEMPETVTTGDIYVYGDYEYRYNQYYYQFYGTKGWYKNESQNGWGVLTQSKTKSVYGQILDSINGKSITSLYNTFYKCTQLTIVSEIPNNVTNMYQTFGECSSLMTVPIIPSGVINMERTFYRCSKIVRSPKIPDSVTNMKNTFEGCTSLTDEGMPNIPSGVISLERTFKECISLDDLSNFIIPSNVTNMYYTFYGCNKLIRSPKIPNSVTNMEYTFEGCASLTDEGMPVIPSGIVSLKNTFKGCTSLNDLSNFIIPNNVTDMDYTFYGCTLLEVVPDFINCTNLKNLRYTFAECISLTSAPKLPNNISHMNGAFKNCISLTDKGMPNIPTCTFSISYAFAGCTSLVDLGEYRIHGNSVYTLSADNVFSGCTSLVTAPQFSGFGLSNVSGALSGCTSLTGEITINIQRISLFTCNDFFSGVDFDKQNITLVGDSKWIDDIGATGINYCIECNGRCNVEH